MSVHYVGFWARVLASLIDTVLLALVIYPIAYAVYGETYFAIGGPIVHGPVDVLLNYVMPLVVIVLFWIYRSATPGKIIIGAKIVDADTLGKPSKRQLLARYLSYYVSLLAFTLGFLWVAWDARKQGFHDKLANTVVIYSKED
jgi:uncharacterized RDD family membrane protein YckC